MTEFVFVLSIFNFGLLVCVLWGVEAMSSVLGQILAILDGDDDDPDREDLPDEVDEDHPPVKLVVNRR